MLDKDLNHTTTTTTTTAATHIPNIVTRVQSENEALLQQSKYFENELSQLENEIKLLTTKYSGHENRLEAIAHSQQKNGKRLGHVTGLYSSLGSECDVMIKKFEMINTKIDDFQRSRTKMKMDLNSVLLPGVGPGA